MSNQVSRDYIIELWYDYTDKCPQDFITASYVDKNTVLILRYCIEYLLHPFIDDSFIDYISKYCRCDDFTINKLSELLLSLDSALDLPAVIDEEYIPL